mgnify:CR=1 FL=1
MGKRRVVLYGNSIILGALKSSLERCPELEVISLSAPLPGANSLAALMPDVILFDIGSARPDPPFILLRDSPNVLLVGVNPEQADLLLWSGNHAWAITASDLIRVIAPPQPE